MTQFIGYQTNADETGAVPVATSCTRETCMEKTIKRVLASGCTVGSITVQQRDDVPADLFVSLGLLLDGFFKEKGIE